MGGGSKPAAVALVREPTPSVSPITQIPMRAAPPQNSFIICTQLPLLHTKLRASVWTFCTLAHSPGQDGQAFVRACQLDTTGKLGGTPCDNRHREPPFND